MKTKNRAVLAFLTLAALSTAVYLVRAQDPSADDKNGEMNAVGSINESGDSEIIVAYKPDITAGNRGTSVPVPGHQAWFVREGDRIDLLASFENQSAAGKEWVTITVIQNALVLGVLRPSNPDETGIIQLLLNPSEAQHAMLSVAQGKVSLTVRAEGDKETRPAEVSSLKKLLK